MINKYLLTILLSFICVSLFSQTDIFGVYVTVLLKDKTQVKGDLIGDFVSTIRLDIEGTEYKIKRKNIEAIIPNYILDSVLVKSVLTEDLIVLKNKKWIPCEILEVNTKQVYVKKNNNTRNLPFSKIESIYPVGQEVTYLSQFNKCTRNKISHRMIKTSGYAKREWYHIVYGNVVFADSNGTGLTGGFGLQYSLGYQFTTNFGLGLGMGLLLDNEIIDENLGFVFPVFGEFRGYFSDKKTSPYYNLAIGMSAGTTPFDESFSKVRPRMYTYPAIGYKIGSDYNAFLIDLGLQLINLEYVSNTSARIVDIDNLVLRIGVMF